MDQLEVEFHADTAGSTFRLTWAQQFHWIRKISRLGDDVRHLNLSVVVNLPDQLAPPGRASVATALRRLVERNESLRTRFSDTPDGPLQQVVQSGTFAVELRQGTPADSRTRAEELAAELAEAPFRHETEWPVRIAVVSAGAAPRHVIFAMAHLIADGAGVLALMEDFGDLLRGQADGTEPARRWQPSDQVRREQSSQAARRNQSALRHWRRQLERIPPSLFPAPAARAEQPRFRRLRLESRALLASAARLAARCQVSMGTTVLAAVVLALSALSGQDTCALEILVGNRFDSGTRTMVGPAGLHGLLVVDCGGGTVAEAVRATHRAATTTFFYGYYDPEDMRQVTDTVAARRGVRFDQTVLYNDLSVILTETDNAGLAQAAADLIPEAEARQLLASSVIVPESTWEGQDCTMYLAARPGPDMYWLWLVADTAYLASPAMEKLLRGVEKIVVEAAFRDVAVADVPALTGLAPRSAQFHNSG